MQIANGALFDRRYRILAVLGSGATGTVYRALDEAAPAEEGDDGQCGPRVVALKVLHESLHPMVNRGFEIEFGVLARLRHPNLVRVDRMGSTDRGVRYLAAECVDGVNLRQAVEGLGAWMLLPLAQGVLLGLDHLHRHGYVHHDVKPTNILVSRVGDDLRPANWTPKLADLGTAVLAGTDPSGALAGTLAYLAPERLTGSRADPRSDIWSLGMTLYACTTGSLHVRARNAVEALNQLQRRPIPPLRDLRPDAPRELEELVHRMLALDPGERFRSAAEALLALQRTLPDPGVESHAAWRDAMVDNAALVGRDPLLSIAKRAFKPRPHAARRTVVVLGPPGSGKSRVVEEVALRSQLGDARAVRVARGHGLAPWRGALEALRGVDRPPPWPGTFEQILGSLTDELQRHGGVLVCDDLHRRDAVTRRMVDRIARALAMMPVQHVCGVLCSADVEVDGEALPDPRGSLRVRLSPLSADEVLEMCASVLGDPPAHVGEAVARASGGSPALVVETLRGALRDGALRRVGGTWRLDDRLVETRSEALDRQLDALDVPALAVLQGVALFGEAGSQVPLTVVEATADLPQPELLQAIERVCSAQLVGLSRSVEAATLSVASESVRRAAIDRAEPMAVARMHLRAFNALRDAGVQDSAALCVHAMGAGRKEAAWNLASRAADDALRVRDGQGALDMLVIADEARTGELSSEEELRLRVRWGRALLLLGRIGEAAALAASLHGRFPSSLDAVRLHADACLGAGNVKGAAAALAALQKIVEGVDATRADRTALRLLEAQVTRASGRARDALVRAERALQELPEVPGDGLPDDDDEIGVLRARAALRAELGQSALALRDTVRVRVELEACMVLQERLGDDIGIAESETSLAVACRIPQETERALAHIDRGLRSARRAGSNLATARLLNAQGTVSLQIGRLQSADEAFAAAEQRAGLAGAMRMGSVAAGNLVIVNERRGLYGRGLAAAVRSYRAKRRLGDRIGQVFTMLNAAVCYIRIGALAVASRLSLRVTTAARAMGHHLLLGNGLLGRALTLVLRAGVAPAASAQSREDAEGALALLAEMERTLPASAATANPVESAVVRAIAAERLGRPREMLAHLDQALHLVDQTGDPYKQAWLRLERARLLDSLDERDLQRVVSLAEQAGALEVGWGAHARLGLLARDRGEEAAGNRELRRAAELLDLVVRDLPSRLRSCYLEGPGRPPLVRALREAGGWKSSRPILDRVSELDATTLFEPAADEESQ